MLLHCFSIQEIALNTPAKPDGQSKVCNGTCAILLHQDVLALDVTVGNSRLSWRTKKILAKEVMFLRTSQSHKIKKQDVSLVKGKLFNAMRLSCTNLTRVCLTAFMRIQYKPSTLREKASAVKRCKPRRFFCTSPNTGAVLL